MGIRKSAWRGGGTYQYGELIVLATPWPATLSRSCTPPYGWCDWNAHFLGLPSLQEPELKLRPRHHGAERACCMDGPPHMWSAVPNPPFGIPPYPYWWRGYTLAVIPDINVSPPTTEGGDQYEASKSWYGVLPTIVRARTRPRPAMRSPVIDCSAWFMNVPA